MKKGLKRFFLLGAAGAAAVTAGAAAVAAHSPKIKKAVTEIVKKRKLTKQEGEELKTELLKELERLSKSAKKTVKRTAKKAANGSCAKYRENACFQSTK